MHFNTLFLEKRAIILLILTYFRGLGQDNTRQKAKIGIFTIYRAKPPKPPIKCKKRQNRFSISILPPIVLF